MKNYKNGSRVKFSGNIQQIYCKQCVSNSSCPNKHLIRLFIYLFILRDGLTTSKQTKKIKTRANPNTKRKQNIAMQFN
jgi:hypothetical protein